MTNRTEKREQKEARGLPEITFRRPVLTPEEGDVIRQSIPSAKPKRTFTFHMKLVESDRDRRQIEGYASTRDLDRTGEIVEPGAFADSLRDFLTNPVVTYMHDWSNPVGKVLEARIDEVGLFIRAEVSQTAYKVWRLIEEGILRAFSIGYEVVEEKVIDEINHILKLRLYEVAIVSIPANRRALFSISKALRTGNDLVAEPVCLNERTGSRSPEPVVSHAAHVGNSPGSEEPENSAEHDAEGELSEDEIREAQTVLKEVMERLTIRPAGDCDGSGMEASFGNAKC